MRAFIGNDRANSRLISGTVVSVLIVFLINLICQQKLMAVTDYEMAQQQYEIAQRYEAEGKWEGAFGNYRSVMITLNGIKRDLPGASRAQIGRRYLKCAVALFNERSKADYVSETVYFNIQDAYMAMMQAEPSNPVWMYMYAVLKSATGHYYLSKKCLELVLQSPNCSPELRQKSQTLLAHIKNYAAQDLAEQQEQVKRAWSAFSNLAHSWGGGMHPISSSSASHGEEKPQGASDDYYYTRNDAWRAYDAGDIDAAHRLQDGIGTSEDHGNYGDH